jgi:hypothetical protein
VTAKSHLSNGKVELDVYPPARAPRSLRVRVRLPQGWSIQSSSSGGRQLGVEKDGTIDLSSERAPCTVTLDVKR